MLPRACVWLALLVPACGAPASPLPANAVPIGPAPQPAPLTLPAPEPSPEPSSSAATAGATLEERMVAHASLGSIREREGELAKASEEYAKVLAAWADPGAAVREIAADAPDDPRNLRRLGRALTALGEARFFQAEQKRKAALALPAPAYLGAASQAAVAKHFSGAVAQFIGKRAALVAEAESAYRSILDIQPLPPPRWVVAAAERVAGLQEATALALEAVPLPPPLAKNAQARAAYESALRDAVRPSRERAKLAYRSCAALAVKYRVEDEHSRRCVAQLAELERTLTP